MTNRHNYLKYLVVAELYSHNCWKYFLSNPASATTSYCKPTFIRYNIISQFNGDKLVRGGLNEYQRHLMSGSRRKRGSREPRINFSHTNKCKSRGSGLVFFFFIENTPKSWNSILRNWTKIISLPRNKQETFISDVSLKDTWKWNYCIINRSRIIFAGVNKKKMTTNREGASLLIYVPSLGGKEG